MNPNDTFPPHNLPIEAGMWARTMKDRVVDSEKQILAAEQTFKSENRATAAVTADLARQLEKLSDFLDELEGLLEEIEELYKAIPKVNQKSETTTGFGPLASGWNTVESVTVTPPEGATKVEITAFGQALAWAQSSSGLVGIESRVVIDGDAGGTFQASITPLGEFQAVSNPQHGRTFDVSGAFTVQLQLRPENASAYTQNSKNSATLTLIASFTGAGVQVGT